MRTVTNIRAKCNDTIKIATVGNIHIEIQVDVVKSSVVEGPRTARLLIGVNVTVHVRYFDPDAICSPVCGIARVITFSILNLDSLAFWCLG